MKAFQRLFLYYMQIGAHLCHDELGTLRLYFYLFWLEQECHQGESSVASETSADSVEVLLAKAVLARAKRKKLRQRSSPASQERLPKVNLHDGVRCGPRYKVTRGKSHYMYANTFYHNSAS